MARVCSNSTLANGVFLRETVSNSVSFIIVRLSCVRVSGFNEPFKQLLRKLQDSDFVWSAFQPAAAFVSIEIIAATSVPNVNKHLRAAKQANNGTIDRCF